LADRVIRSDEPLDDMEVAYRGRGKPSRVAAT